MVKRFCDRCKEELDYREMVELNIKPERTDNTGYLSIQICEKCANDFANMIDYECQRFKLGTVVTISKEAE